MKKILTALCVAWVACSAAATPVKTADDAVALVMKSVQKNKLLPIPLECVFFMENGSTDAEWVVDVREKHDDKCGGDPETAPRLMTYEINKKTGKRCTDSRILAERVGTDPIDLLCNPIK